VPVLSDATRLYFSAQPVTAAYVGSTKVWSPTSEFARREALVVGTYKPDATNTGLLGDPARPLTVVNGDYTASTAGAAIKDLEIRGRLIVTAANVTVDNCWVRGPATWPDADSGLVLCSNPSLNLVLRDCLLQPQTPDERIDGIRYNGYTAIRCRILQVVDGLAMFSTSAGAVNAYAYGCWIGPLTKFYPDAVHTDGTHNDGVQLQGGSTAVIRGCRIDGTIDQTTGNTGGLNTNPGGAAKSPVCRQINAVIQLNANTGPLAGVTIEDNWLYGGILGINGLDSDFSTASNLTGLVIRRNRFGRDQYNNTYATLGRIGIKAGPSITCPTSGADANVYEDDGTPVELVRAA
jgi:hypothetical protein